MNKVILYSVIFLVLGFIIGNYISSLNKPSFSRAIPESNVYAYLSEVGETNLISGEESLWINHKIVWDYFAIDYSDDGFNNGGSPAEAYVKVFDGEYYGCGNLRYSVCVCQSRILDRFFIFNCHYGAYLGA